MRFEAVYRQLSKNRYYVFSCEDIGVFFPKEKRATIKQCLSRWKASGLIASLRKDLYELVFPTDRAFSDMHLANKIYSPSYVSLETALSHYNLIPEISMAVLSITAKATRQFKNSHGLFVYRSVQPQAFCGYTIENHDGFDILIAEPEKALADFVYFKTRSATKPDFSSFRLDRKRVARLNKKKLNHLLHKNNK